MGNTIINIIIVSAYRWATRLLENVGKLESMNDYFYYYYLYYYRTTEPPMANAMPYEMTMGG